jgi:FecR-like protein
LREAPLNQPLYLLTLVTFTTSFVNWPTSGLNAVPPNEARITRVSNRVQVLHPPGAAHAASLNDIIDEDTIVRTGKSSYAELAFSNETIVRLAANTALNFRDGTRELNLTEGAALIQAPKNASGATIHAASVAAAIAGTTSMIEYHPGVCKFLVLEGTGRLYRPRHLGDSVLVGPGQLVMGNPNAAVSDPVDFDIDRFVKTSRFLVGLPPLRSEKLVAAECQKQQREKSKKTLIDTNLVIFGGGTRVSLVGQAQTGAVGGATTAPAVQVPTPRATGASQ